jgi:PTH1 family peptidyl-tRNA hydrolase
MNNSGGVLPGLRRLCPGTFLPGSLIVVCDNCDLPPGQIRVKRGGSSAGQKGLQSIIQGLGSPDFWRVYVGIGRPEDPGRLVEYVLSSPPAGEGGGEAGRLEAGEEQAAGAALALCTGDPVRVMNEYNRKKT